MLNIIPICWLFRAHYQQNAYVHVNLSEQLQYSYKKWAFTLNSYWIFFISIPGILRNYLYIHEECIKIDDRVYSTQSILYRIELLVYQRLWRANIKNIKVSSVFPKLFLFVWIVCCINFESIVFTLSYSLLSNSNNLSIHFHSSFMVVNHDQFIPQWHHIMFSDFFFLFLYKCNPHLPTRHCIAVKQPSMTFAYLSLLVLLFRLFFSTVTMKKNIRCIFFLSLSIFFLCKVSALTTTIFGHGWANSHCLLYVYEYESPSRFDFGICV